LLKGKPFTCNTGEQIRDFLYVDDLAAAFISVLESELTGPINLASGVPVAVKKVAKRIGDQLNRQDLITFRMLEPQTAEPPLVVADVRRLFNELAWRPIRSLNQGLEETIFWWRKQLGGSQ
jgi:nucleoside-diphosphate-sugar epimerase